ncbi:hypothetical protein HA402_004991 [Bradysia odoriphaga]|nr:hypothetical protein HA402_004991 [Bradysia odoriphaga]
MVAESIPLNNITSTWENYTKYENFTGKLLNATLILPSANDTLASKFIINNAFVQAAFSVFYIAIFVVGIMGNVLVCYVVFRNKAMHTVTNLFITNLALSDILLCFLAVPFTPLYTFLERWIFGNLLCHMVPFSQGVSVYISTLTLTSIAMDRFVVIIYPFRHRMKLSTCISLITSIWIISLMLTLPYGLYVSLNNYPESPELNYCEEDWPDEVTRKVYGTVTVFLQFIFPFAIMSVCYILVSIKLNDRAKSKPGSKTSKKEEADRDRKKRTNRMLISMVAVFGISWLPLNAVNIFNDYYETKSEYYTLLFFIAHCIAMSSTCYNPILYAWLNDNFRKEFKLVLPCYKHSLNNGVYNRVYRPNQTFCNGNEAGHRESLLDGTTTRVTEIIPRGPTCNSSIKKPIVKPLTVNNDSVQLSDTVNGHQTTSSTKISSTGVLETPFDIETLIEGSSEAKCRDQPSEL